MLDPDETESSHEDTECMESREEHGEIYNRYVVYDECVPVAETAYRLQAPHVQAGHWFGRLEDTSVIMDAGPDCGVCDEALYPATDDPGSSCAVPPDKPASPRPVDVDHRAGGVVGCEAELKTID